MEVVKRRKELKKALGSRRNIETIGKLTKTSANSIFFWFKQIFLTTEVVEGFKKRSELKVSTKNNSMIQLKNRVFGKRP